MSLTLASIFFSCHLIFVPSIVQGLELTENNFTSYKQDAFNRKFHYKIITLFKSIRYDFDPKNTLKLVILNSDQRLAKAHIWTEKLKLCVCLCLSIVFSISTHSSHSPDCSNSQLHLLKPKFPTFHRVRARQHLQRIFRFSNMAIFH